MLDCYMHVVNIPGLVMAQMSDHGLFSRAMRQCHLVDAVRSIVFGLRGPE
ncbi:hypothetical protein U370_01030 [Anaplasma marginale str. Dawn]|nr:hypothetical protein U128_01030 [Anaplasma marginale str. Gypsy Plains]AGZ79500.1 hypothetical protein U370_01030 [Anaplasma marginale str. Dawn]